MVRVMKTFEFNPLSPNINVQILLSDLNTFFIVLVGRIRLKIKANFLSLSFYQFS